MGEFLVELWSFMQEQKKSLASTHYLCLLLLGGLIVLSSGSAVAPFIYTVL